MTYEDGGKEKESFLLTEKNERLTEENERLTEENERLKAWVRQEGVRTDACTYDVLHEICEGCRCNRQP